MVRFGFCMNPISVGPIYTPAESAQCSSRPREPGLVTPRRRIQSERGRRRAEEEGSARDREREREHPKLFKKGIKEEGKFLPGENEVMDSNFKKLF